MHTRIPVALECEIKRLADGLRVPVSNLIRQILEDGVELVGNVGTRVGAIQREVQRDREHVAERWAHYRQLFHGLKRESLPSAAEAVVYGWQSFIVGVAACCQACQCELAEGKNAFIGLSSDPTARFIRCASCVTVQRPSRQTPSTKKKGTPR